MNRIFLCIIPLFLILKAHGQELQNIPRLKVSLNAGYATEKLSWSIAGNAMGTSPNVYSELIWKNLKGTAIGINLKYQYLGKFFIEGQYRSKHTNSGWVNDTDYGADNRTFPTYTTTLNTHGGSSNNFSAGTGYDLPLTKKLHLAGSIGYVRDQQRLLINDTKSSNNLLKSSYETDWTGAYIKLEPEYQLSNLIRISAGISYQQQNYKAKGNWNLRDDFQQPLSYSHHAKGYSLNNHLNVSIKVYKNLFVRLDGNYQTWETGNGTDKLFLITGKTPQTRLNEVNSSAYRFSSGVEMRFY